MALDKTESLFDVDYIGMVLKPSCVTRQAINQLIRHQRPRAIYVVTPETSVCKAALEPLAPNVRCVHEDSVLPGVNKASIQRQLQERFRGLAVNTFEKGRTPAGWYLQQVLKLGVVQGLPELSEYYVIWDFDMIPVRRIPLFYAPARAVAPRAVPPGSRPPMRTAVNIGGARALGYEASYQMLFGRELEHAPDGSSFVTHWIVVHKPHMLAFLRALQPRPDAQSWIDNVLEHLPEEHLFQGFSEYASYVSWVRQQHPESQYMLPRKTWRRQPLGGGLAVWLATRSHADGLCCPVPWQHALQRLVGYQYYGLEIGHHDFCRWTDQKFTHSYGL